MEKRIIKITNKQEEQFDVEIILCFEIPELNKKYIIFSYPEEETEANVTINTGELKEVDGKYILLDIENDKEWEFIKKVMTKIVNENEGEN